MPDIWQTTLPIAEELAFRGLFMAALRRMRVAIPWAILLTAAVWSIIHLQYSPLLLALIVVDGIALGLARHYSGSLYVPIAMHVIGNLFSIYQSLT
jgi:membrane protease YdiL (CAAX protease family)